MVKCHQDEGISLVFQQLLVHNVEHMLAGAQHHLDRAHRAWLQAGAALPHFGGFDLLEP